MGSNSFYKVKVLPLLLISFAFSSANNEHQRIGIGFTGIFNDKYDPPPPLPLPPYQHSSHRDGQCPPRIGFTGYCMNECYSDYDCYEPSKCCYNGCVRMCIYPIGMTTATTTTTTSTTTTTTTTPRPTTTTTTTTVAPYTLLPSRSPCDYAYCNRNYGYTCVVNAYGAPGCVKVTSPPATTTTTTTTRAPTTTTVSPYYDKQRKCAMLSCDYGSQCFVRYDGVAECRQGGGFPQPTPLPSPPTSLSCNELRCQQRNDYCIKIMKVETDVMLLAKCVSGQTTPIQLCQVNYCGQLFWEFKLFPSLARATAFFCCQTTRWTFFTRSPNAALRLAFNVALHSRAALRGQTRSVCRL